MIRIYDHTCCDPAEGPTVGIYRPLFHVMSVELLQSNTWRLQSCIKASQNKMCGGRRR